MEIEGAISREQISQVKLWLLKHKAELATRKRNCRCWCQENTWDRRLRPARNDVHARRQIDLQRRRQHRVWDLSRPAVDPKDVPPLTNAAALRKMLDARVIMDVNNQSLADVLEFPRHMEKGSGATCCWRRRVHGTGPGNAKLRNA